MEVFDLASDIWMVISYSKPGYEHISFIVTLAQLYIASGMIYAIIKFTELRKIRNLRKKGLITEKEEAEMIAKVSIPIGSCEDMPQAITVANIAYIESALTPQAQLSVTFTIFMFVL